MMPTVPPTLRHTSTFTVHEKKTHCFVYGTTGWQRARHARASTTKTHTQVELQLLFSSLTFNLQQSAAVLLSGFVEANLNVNIVV